MPRRSSCACSTSAASSEIGAHRPAGIHRRGLARLPARRAAGHHLRLPRARPLRARRPGTASIPTSSLLDPYAKQLVGELEWNPALFGYTIEIAATTSPSTSATARPSCMKARVIDPAFTWGRDRRPSIAVGEDDHLRDARARLHHASPGRARSAARHLCGPRAARRSSITSRALGVTAVELLPVHTFVDDSYLIDKGLTNYWGYNTIGVLRPGAALRGQRASSPSPSSRRWWRTCTTPASR